MRLFQALNIVLMIILLIFLINVVGYALFAILA